MNYELLIAPENREWCEWANETNQAKLAPFVYLSYSRSQKKIANGANGRMKRIRQN
jgi:hypothetical protein